MVELVVRRLQRRQRRRRMPRVEEPNFATTPLQHAAMAGEAGQGKRTTCRRRQRRR